MGILNRIVERRVAPAPTSGFAEAFAQQGPTWSGATVTQDSALTLSAVYTSVSLIADAVSSLPVDVVRTVGQTRKPATGPVWLNSPNPFDTPFDFWQKVMTSLLMDGNAFVRVIRSSQGKVVALMPLDPRTVRVELTEDQSGVLYKFGDTTLSARDVVHVKGFAQASSLRGLSPLESARQTIGAGLATQEFGARFFRQGTTMSGVIEHPGNPKPGEVAILARMLKKSHAGTKNSHAVGVLTGVRRGSRLASPRNRHSSWRRSDSIGLLLRASSGCPRTCLTRPRQVRGVPVLRNNTVGSFSKR